MLYPIISLVLGLIVLVWSADKFVFGAAGTAKNLGMSPLLIGLTIVSFGTSAPEILVSIMATLDDSGTLAIGNAIGSNIANIALVLGVTALIAPLPVSSTVKNKEMPLMLGVTVIAGTLLFNLQLTIIDSIILFTALVISLVIFAKFQQKDDSNDDDDIPTISTATGIIWFIIGLILLIASSKALVWGATKGQHDIAIGNVIGSNIFNLGAVMTIPGLASTIDLQHDVFYRDYLLMLALSALLLTFCFLRKPAKIKRLEGSVFVAIYTAYMAVLYFTAI